MREPPLHYATFNAPPGREWRTARRWPLPEERRTIRYFTAGPSGSIRSINDGGLDPRRPRGPGADSGLVDTTRSAGPDTRYSNGYGGPAGYGDQAGGDARAWTYTTPPLTEPLEVTGHPVVRLWLSADQPDADVFLQLSEVLPGGESRFVTDGRRRASHARTTRPPYRYLGLPFHASTRESLVALGPSPLLLEVDLLPTSYLFRLGSRIRVTVAGADFHTVSPRRPPARFTIHRSARFPSAIDLPVIPVPR
jgi:putative CocE/NonD family hydrolase